MRTKRFGIRAMMALLFQSACDAWAAILLRPSQKRIVPAKHNIYRGFEKIAIAFFRISVAFLHRPITILNERFQHVLPTFFLCL